MRLVPVGSTFAMVDDEDFERVLNLCSWSLDRKGYARGIPRIGKLGCKRGVKRPRPAQKRMHRFILGVTNELEVDHVDGDRLNNQKSNLRTANDKQNARNRRALTKGIHQLPNGRWRARFMSREIVRSLGCYATKEEAMAVWNTEAQKEYGEFAYLNKL